MINFFNEKSSILVFCFCLFQQLDISFSSESNVPCDEGWQPNLYSGTCLKMFETAATWDEARKVCRDQHGDLVKVINKKMDSSFIEFSLSLEGFWIGLKKEDHGVKLYNWSRDNSSLTYSSALWKFGSFENTCVLFKTNTSLISKWQEAKCSTEHPFMCEQVTVTFCSLGWTAYWESGTCIKINETKMMVWTKAQETCMANNGKLLEIINADMNEFVSDLVDQRHPDVKLFWIGMNNINASHYRWNDDNEPANFTNQLSQFGRGSSTKCAALGSQQSGRWFSLSPKSPFFFICEKPSELFCDGMIYGMTCKENCSNGCASGDKKTLCDPKTGLCMNGCKPSYRGAFCNEVCPDNTYGSNCLGTCSSYCAFASPLCDKKSGNCREGCLDGYFGTRCDSECPKNTYGTNCWRHCSPNCAGSECDKKDGHCLNGCSHGYLGDMCQEACSNNTYGANCSETCNKNCLNTFCSHVDGRCLSGCESLFEGIWCDVHIKTMGTSTTDPLKLAAAFIVAAFGIAFLAVMCIAKTALKFEKTLAESSSKVTGELIYESSKELEDLLIDLPAPLEAELTDGLPEPLKDKLTDRLPAPLKVELVDRLTAPLKVELVDRETAV